MFPDGVCQGLNAINMEALQQLPRQRCWGGSPCPRTGGVEVGHCWGSRSAAPWGHLWAHGAFPKSWEKVEVLGEVQGG